MFELGGFELGRVHCVDCLEALKQLPDKCVDLVLTDPPYGHNNNCCDDLISWREPATGQKAPKKREDLIGKWEWVLGKMTREECAAQARPIANDGREADDTFRACAKEYSRLLVAGGCCCCCCGGGGPDPQFARWSLWLDEAIPFKMMVVWDKGPIGMGWHYRRSYETILVAQKQGAACKWYDTTQQIENILRPSPKWPKIIPSREQHPTEKPVGLMEHFIMLHTQPDDLILDPFMGSGTTGVAAVQLGRQFLGFEIDPEYCRLANDRIEAARKGLKLNEYRQGQQTLFGGDL